MTRTRVGICCIQSPAEARMAALAEADLIGLVGAMPSDPGPIADAVIARIASAAPPGAETVLLTAETAPEAASAHVTRCRPQAVQLVDHEALVAQPRLRAENVAEAIRAVRPHGVDFCFGRRTGGALDAAKLSAFTAAVASA